jgi:hypothetical protein
MSKPNGALFRVPCAVRVRWLDHNAARVSHSWIVRSLDA